MISFVILIIVLIILFKSDGFSTLLQVDLNQIRKMSNGNLFLILLIMLGIMVVQNLFTIIPLILVISVNISLFGFVNGYLWSWVSSVIGGILAFLMARYWFQDLLLKHLNPKYQKWTKVENKGFLFVFLGRVFPFAPTSLINIAAGVSAVPLRPFIIGTITGNMIFFFAISLIVKGLWSVQLENNVLLILGAIIVLLVLILWRIRSKRIKRTRGETSEFGG
ncbi:TVP38/TMEM64 family protein [Paenibacillus anaericanus]|uniref:TVP38/TMEM64 family membrane protein n=1 Tax=Paenibacillus anaericanus TaxID=170367 RepID=A0A3S1CAE4_9BACL|nr:TVP38/TMEM64 family protein [Paenibacillus anaericanus]